MGDIHWDAAATVHQRDDGGSDMFYEFKTLNSGSLSEMVKWVMALPSDERARVVIDAAGIGSINVLDVVKLAARDDFPSQ